MLKKYICHISFLLLFGVFCACIGIILQPTKTDVKVIEKPIVKEVYITNQADAKIQSEYVQLKATIETENHYKKVCEEKITKLERIAQDEGLTICYVPQYVLKQYEKDLGFVAGGLYFEDKKTIYIDLQYQDFPPLLAHELGHYFANKYENNYSEDRATEIGEILIKNGEYSIDKQS